MELVKIKTARNESGFQKQTIHPSPAGSRVGTVPFDAAERALSLNGAVHT